MAEAPKEEDICAWFPCQKQQKSRCTNCQSVFYCSAQCQQKHWPFHQRISCISPEVPRHHVFTAAVGTTSTSSDVATIQAVIDRASPGDVIEIPPGTYTSTGAGATPLKITKPLNLWGGSTSTNTTTRMTKEVVLQCNVEVTFENASKKHHLVMRHMKVEGNVTVACNTAGGVYFYNMQFDCPSQRDDALEISSSCRAKKVLILECEILGGADGLCLYSSDHDMKIHIQRCKIVGAGSRGIFADSYFTIENSLVDMCGSYGIKCRAGFKEVGSCHIQSSPWGPHGGAVMGGTYGRMQGYPQVQGLPHY
jgi:hypothetical protein